MTLAGRAATEAHRLGQLKVRAATIRDVLAVWQFFDPEDIAGTWPAVEAALLAIIGTHSAESAAMAAEYYRAFRYVEGISGSPAVRVAPLPPAKEIATSLRYVGVVNAYKLIEARRPDVGRTTFVNVAGDTSRHTLNRGRDTLLESVDADDQALGWARVTDGHACAWCRMLASRGPVYRSKEKTGARKWHLKCGCTAEPVYRHDQPWPGRAEEFKQQWDETTKGLSGADARKAFRQAVEGRATPTS